LVIHKGHEISGQPRCAANLLKIVPSRVSVMVAHHHGKKKFFWLPPEC